LDDAQALRYATAVLFSESILEVLDGPYRFRHRTSDAGNFHPLYFSPRHGLRRCGSSGRVGGLPESAQPATEQPARVDVELTGNRRDDREAGIAAGNVTTVQQGSVPSRLQHVGPAIAVIVFLLGPSSFALRFNLTGSLTGSIRDIAQALQQGPIPQRFDSIFHRV
jgi:hypothetical protein